MLRAAPTSKKGSKRAFAAPGLIGSKGLFASATSAEPIAHSSLL
jgi:hypothetical protein